MLYLSDLDFTLLRSDLTISDFTKNVWNSFTTSNKLSIATARSYTGVKELLKGLELKEPLILLDGTIIASPDGKILHMSAIDKELGDVVLESIHKELNSYPLIVSYESESEQFFYPKELNIYQKELLKSMKNRRRIFENRELRAKSSNLKMVYLTTKEDAKILENCLKKELGDSVEIKSAQDPYIDCYFTTILNPDGDKAHALKYLEDIEGVTANDTTVFGDSHNDIGMFKLAGTKVAVANAIDELKELADIILPYSNNEDAVAKYLKQINV